MKRTFFSFTHSRVILRKPLVSKSLIQTALLVCLCVLIISPAPITIAEQQVCSPRDSSPACQDYYISNNIPYYDPDDTCVANPSSSSSSTGSGSGTVSSGQVKEIQEKLLRFFTSKGFTLAQAAGIAGNVQQESSFNPKAENSIGAYGLFQWLNGRRTGLEAYAASKGTQISDPDTQFEYVWIELNSSEKKTRDAFAANTKMTPQEAASVWRKLFERPGEAEANDSGRANAAVDIYNQFKGIIADGTGIQTDSTSSASTSGSSGSSSYSGSNSCFCQAPGASTASSSSTTSPGGSTGQKDYPLPGDSAFVKSVADAIGTKFNLESVGGKRPGDSGNHGSGRAIDVMMTGGSIPFSNPGTYSSDQLRAMKERGDPIFEYIKANKAAMHVVGMIWQQRYYNLSGDNNPSLGSGKLMENRGNDTQNHYDHIHVDFAADVVGNSSTVSGLTDTPGGGSNGSCSSSSATGGSIVEIAEAELAKNPVEYDENVLKYTGGQSVDWCAYFVSWVYAQAGTPFPGGPIGSVGAMLDYFKKSGVYFEKGKGTPQPGDVAFHGISHVGIVSKVDGDNIETIDGNYSDKVGRVSIALSSSDITGFGRMK